MRRKRWLYSRRQRIRLRRLKQCIRCGILAIVILAAVRLPNWVNRMEKEKTSTQQILKESETQEQSQNEEIPLATECINPPQNVDILSAKEGVRVDESEEVRGIYVTSSSLNTKEKVEELIQTIKETTLNAVVFNIKDDSGYLTFPAMNETANEIGAVTNQIGEIRWVIDQLHANHIYVIGRVVAFKDPVMAKAIPSYALKFQNGKIFTDYNGCAWLNPYNEDTWDYLVDISLEAAQLGIDEIQFDYVRFSTQATENTVWLDGNGTGLAKSEIITEFVKYAVKKLHAADVKVSCDVFGTIINSVTDAQIVGQDYEELSRYLDYICPMIYPSHYGDGCYGVDYPDLYPYEVILSALKDSSKVLARIDEEEHQAVVRPWLQDFTASWKKPHQVYGKDQVEQQIEAVYDTGYSQWLLWNSSGKYTTEALE